MPADHDTVIADLKAEVRAFCEARDWDQFHGPKDLAIGIATEASELLELFRFATAEDEEALVSPVDPDARAAIAAELADVLIFVLRFAQRFDFDLSGCFTSSAAWLMSMFSCTSRGEAMGEPCEDWSPSAPSSCPSTSRPTGAPTVAETSSR